MMPRIHDTAIVEADVVVGDGTSVWDNAHLRTGAAVGDGCIIGDKSYVGPHVVIGDRCKLNTSVYLCTGVTLERGVMVSAHVVFTNDRFPRATTPDLTELLPSEADEETLDTTVREGATIGANATIGPGIEIGRFAMVGMGSVVTRSVGDFQLVVGTPATTVGYVCRCGHRLATVPGGTEVADTHHVACGRCGRAYAITAGVVDEVGEPGS